MNQPSSLRVVTRQTVRQVAYWLIALLGFGHRLIRRPPPARPVQRILIIRLDLLGDVLFSTYAVQALRNAFPTARIVMLTLPYTEPLARAYTELDDVVSVDTNRIRTVRGLANPATWIGYWRAVRQLRAERFDVALSLSGPMASLWAFLSGAPRSVGYATEAYPFLLTDPVPGGRYDRPIHEVEYVGRLAEELGAKPKGDLRVPVPAGSERRVDALLSAARVDPEARLVLVHAGSVNGSAKRWPPDRWAAFSDALQERAEVRVGLIGAASDQTIAGEVIARARRPIDSFVGLTDVGSLVGLIDRADLVATGDSGPLHLAVALGKPIVAPYGPTDPRVHGPFRPRAPVAIHRYDLPCSPCYSMAATAECPLGDPICMRLVTVDEMVESAARLLASPTGKRPAD